MIRINLLPTKDAERVLGARNQRALLALAVSALALVMVVPYMWQRNRLDRLSRNIESVQQQVDRLTELVKDVEKLDKLKAELEAKLKVIADLNDMRAGPAKMLESLSKATPDSLWVTKLSESGGRIRFNGISLDNETIADFMKHLDTYPHFYDVDLRVVDDARDRARGFKRFELSSRVDFFGEDGKRERERAAAAEKAAAEKAKKGRKRR